MVRILVVKDETHLAGLIARMLGEEGYAAETAADGRTGLARAMTEPFDLLIVDWMLPELDGVKLLRRLRAADRAFTRFGRSLYPLLGAGYAARPAR